MSMIHLSHVAKEIKPGFEILKDLLHDANLVFDSMGMTVTAFDPEKMVMVQAAFSAISDYTITGATQNIVGVYMPFLYKTVRHAKDADLIQLEVQDEVLIVRVVDGESSLIKIESKMPSVMMPVETPVFSSHQQENWAVFNTKGLWKSAREIASVDKTTRLVSDFIAEKIELITQSAMGDYKSDLTRYKESEANPVSAEMAFYVNSLTKFCKHRISKQTSMYIHPSHPLCLRATNAVVDVIATIALIQ